MEYTESIHEALYTLEYRLIPTYLNDDEFYYLESVESLFDGVSWNEMFEDDSWKDIDFQKIQVMHFSSYPLSYFVIKFPDPMEEPLAYYGMVVKWMGAASSLSVGETGPCFHTSSASICSASVEFTGSL